MKLQGRILHPEAVANVARPWTSPHAPDSTSLSPPSPVVQGGKLPPAAAAGHGGSPRLDGSHGLSDPAMGVAARLCRKGHM